MLQAVSPSVDVIKPLIPERLNCLECTYTCYCSQHLELHSDIHRVTPDTTLAYRCKQCPFRCAAFPALQAHMRGHPGRHILRQYSCAHCSIEMCNKDDIEDHVKKMHNNVCIYKVVRYVVIGAKEPPKCLLCNEQFSLYSILLQHVEKEHGENAVNKHTAEGILLFDDCQVPMDIKPEEHQTEPIAKLQVHAMSPHKAAKVYQTLISCKNTKSELIDNEHIESVLELPNAIDVSKVGRSSWN